MKEGSPFEQELEEPQDTPVVLVPQDMQVGPERLELDLDTAPVRLETGQEAVVDR